MPGAGANVHTLHEMSALQGQQQQEAEGRLDIYQHTPGPHNPAAGSERRSFGAERVKGGERCLESSHAGKLKEHWRDHGASPAQATTAGILL